MFDPRGWLTIQLDALMMDYVQAVTGVSCWLKFVDDKVASEGDGLYAVFGSPTPLVVAKDDLDKHPDTAATPLASIQARRDQIVGTVVSYAFLAMRAAVNAYLRKYALKMMRRLPEDDTWFSYEIVFAYTGVDLFKLPSFPQIEWIDGVGRSFERFEEPINCSSQSVPVALRAIALFAQEFDTAFKVQHPEVYQ